MKDNSRYNCLTDEKHRLLAYAWGHSQLDMHKEAVMDCEKLVELDADDPSFHIELGFYYEKNGEIDRATECYRNAMKRFPRFYASYTNMGHYFQVHKKRYDIAMVCYEKALEFNPHDTWSLNNIGTIAQNEGRWTEALYYYKKAYEASRMENITDHRILHNLAWAYNKCKDYREARRLFIDLVRLCPDNSSIYSDFGCVSYKMGLYDEAMELFSKALSIYPESKYYRRLCKMVNRKAKN